MRKLRKKTCVNDWVPGILSFVLFPYLAYGQQLITFAGAQQGDAQGTYLGWSVGELLIQPLAAKTAYLTQGFRQPYLTALPTEESAKACATQNGLTIYNGITPNGDLVNDELRIVGIDQYPENTLYIFNRWNTVLFQKQGYSNDLAWGGTDQNGSALPSGIYYYRLYLKKEDSKSYCEGRILIVR